MSGDEAQTLCPDISLIRVLERRGKADLTKYRKASTEVMQSISHFSDCLERASIDEAFIDVTSAVEKRMKDMPFLSLKPEVLENTHVVGWELSDDQICVEETEDNEDMDHVDINGAQLSSSEKLAGDQMPQPGGAVSQWLASCIELEDKYLAYGALIVEEMRAFVFKQTGFTCSAGISHNKVLAKLVCGLHKPNQQTVLPMSQVDRLFDTLPLKKLRNLGGKLGASVTKRLSVNYVGEIRQYTLQRLQDEFGDKTGYWLFNVSRGLNFEPVRPRQLPKSIGCSKNFPGKTKLMCHEQIKHWFTKFAEELCERLESDMAENSRVAKHLSIHFWFEDWDSGVSRSCPLTHYDVEHIAHAAYVTLLKGRDIAPSSCESSETPGPTVWSPCIVNLGMSASQFVDLSSTRIDQFLTPGANPESSINTPTITQPKPTTQPEMIKEQQSIPSFFTKKQKTDINDDELISSEVDGAADTQLTFCSKCGRKVPASEIQEHDDYHYALDVQREMDTSYYGFATSSGGKSGGDRHGVNCKRKRFGSDITDFFK
jgi:DNA polymerase eta